MDTGKQTIEANRRADKASQVFLKFHGFNNNYFKVYDGKKVKYIGHLDPLEIFHSCSCKSFFFGMKYPLPKDQTVPFSSLYFAEHGHTFSCKHIIAAIVHKEKMK